MREMILGFSFIFSTLIYLVVAFFIKDIIKPSFHFQKDISLIFYVISFIIFMIALYFAKFRTFQNKIIALTISEIPAILGFAYFIFSGNINLLFRIVIISVLVMLYIILTRREKVEN